MAGFGIVEAAQRAREWSPHLESTGQRLVLACLVAYTGPDSVAHPSRDQLAAFTGYTARAIPRILTELVELDVIAPLSDRSGGRGKTTRWTIKPCPGSHPLDTERVTGERERVTWEDIKGDLAVSPVESSELSEKNDQPIEEAKNVRELIAASAAKHSIEAS